MRGRARHALRLAALATLLAVAPLACARPPATPDGGGSTPAPTPTPPPAEEETKSARTWPRIRVEERWSGFDEPLYLTHAGEGTGTLYVVEKGGRVLGIGPGGKPLDAPLIDVSGQVSTGSEQGLLGLAFDPRRQGVFYIDFTDSNGDTVIRRYDPPTFNHPVRGRPVPRPSEDILKVDQPYANHNGGQLAFGPDGMLYIGLGDGGSGGDPERNAQDPGSLLGKVLRIDVSRAKGYSVPEDNPFVGREGARGEVWHLGLRNPWRFSFDAKTGEMWIGDVGQGALEEIDVAPKGKGGLNFGWDLYEGTERFEEGGQGPGELTAPVAEYGRDLGISVTGGYVWRAGGPLEGVYLYADYGSGRIWGLRARDGRWESRQLADTDLSISSFGVDEGGRMYVTDLAGGGVHAITAEE